MVWVLGDHAVGIHLLMTVQLGTQRARKPPVLQMTMLSVLSLLNACDDVRVHACAG
jgi:hypothetical protein